MNPDEEKKASKLALGAGYAGLFGLGVLRLFRSKRSSSPARSIEPSAEPSAIEQELQKPAPLGLPGPKPPREELPSLSLNTGSDSPLDRLARRAHWEEEEEAKIKPGGGRAEVRSSAPIGAPQPWTYGSPIVNTMLEQQPLEAERLTGWTIPQPERVPVPTFAPSVMAMGIVLFAMGLATSFYVCVVGSVVFAVAAWRWTGILQGD